MGDKMKKIITALNNQKINEAIAIEEEFEVELDEEICDEQLISEEIEENEEDKKIKVAFNQALSLIKKSNGIRVIIDKNEKTMINVPVAVSVVGIVLLPIYSLVGVSTAVLTKYRLKIQNENDGTIVDLGELTTEKLDTVKNMIVNTAKDVRKSIKREKNQEELEVEEFIDEINEMLANMDIIIDEEEARIEIVEEETVEEEIEIVEEETVEEEIEVVEEETVEEEVEIVEEEIQDVE
jgi:hypothetical protein